MTSRNELYKYLAKSLIRNKLLDGDAEVAQASGGDMFVRLGAEVFRIDVQAVDAINQHQDPEAQAKAFMSTLPYPYTKADA